MSSASMDSAVVRQGWGSRGLQVNEVRMQGVKNKNERIIVQGASLGYFADTKRSVVQIKY
jgi:hypothetical protein